jgi:hypothetical protein
MDPMEGRGAIYPDKDRKLADLRKIK